MTKTTSENTIKAHETTLRNFIGKRQLAAMVSYAKHSEERDFFLAKIEEYASRVATMPKTYEQDGKGGDAVVYLHYFWGGSDWYIIERDTEDEQHQAFGYAILNGDICNAELGYISIEELAGHGVELDLHWQPKTLREVKERINA